MNFIGQVFYHFELREYVVVTKFDGESLTYHGEGRLVGHCSIERFSEIMGPASIDTLTPQELDKLLYKICSHSNYTKLHNGTDLTKFTTITEDEND